jgi:hypothetical protein
MIHVPRSDNNVPPSPVNYLQTGVAGSPTPSALGTSPKSDARIMIAYARPVSDLGEAGGGSGSDTHLLLDRVVKAFRFELTQAVTGCFEMICQRLGQTLVE